MFQTFFILGVAVDRPRRSSALLHRVKCDGRARSFGLYLVQGGVHE